MNSLPVPQEREREAGALPRVEVQNRVRANLGPDGPTLVRVVLSICSRSPSSSSGLRQSPRGLIPC
jgi:hypothetical protein